MVAAEVWDIVMLVLVLIFGILKHKESPARGVVPRIAG